ncbi:MAG: type IV pilus modification protein PilV [Halopseudomonas aestusnigri]|nr:type IV pilus modification protein PilV [Halopseudomonas aestusnigri]
MLRSAVRGFGLLEVLVTILVLSVGLLGMAALQLNAMKYNQTASVRTHAVVLAYDIADRMRANRAIARSGGYAISLTAAASGSGIAGTDLAAWKQAVASTLPNGQGAVQMSGNVTTITVQWDESRSGGSATQQFEFETKL